MTTDEQSLLQQVFERQQDLIDRQQILDCLHRYCRGIDRCDADLINSCYHDDAEVAYQSFTAVGKEIGPAAVNLVKNKSPRKTSMHYIMNHLVQIDGNFANAETYFCSAGLSLSSEPEKLLENGGRYLDRFEKRDGEWKIIERGVLWDWRRTTALEKTLAEVAGAGKLGSQDKSDLSYKYLTDF